MGMTISGYHTTCIDVEFLTTIHHFWPICVTTELKKLLFKNHSSKRLDIGKQKIYQSIGIPLRRYVTITDRYGGRRSASHMKRRS